MAVLLTDFDKLKSLLNLSKNESEYPDLMLLQDGVVAQMEAYTRRKFECCRRVDVRFVHCDTKMIDLLAIPICNVHSVEVDGVKADCKITDYGVRLAEFAEDARVVVEYTGGLKELEDELVRAATIQTVFEYQNKHSVGLKSTSNDGGSINKITTGLLPEVRAILDNYKHPMRLM